MNTAIVKKYKNIVFKIAFLFLFLGTSQIGFGQTDIRIFKDTRIINLHSVETIKKGKLDFRIGHKFGDLAGSRGGWPTFYGLENAADVFIGFNYGITDNLLVGISRTKGSGILKQNINGQIKYKLLEQNSAKGKPISMTVHAMFSTSTATNNPFDAESDEFAKFIHRVVYHLQYITAKKFGDRFSLQANIGWTFRNIVTVGDRNDLVSLGGSMKYQFSKVFAVILEGAVPFSDFRTRENEYYPATGIGFEWETGGGHIFQINFTNARGIVETDFLPNNNESNWGDGEFRLGFTISRLFTL